MSKNVTDWDGAGATISRKLVDHLGDVSGFRTVIISGPDAVYRLKTKGGRPEVTKETAKMASPEQTRRSFVFRPIETPPALIATVANKAGGNFKVLTRKQRVDAVTVYATSNVVSPRNSVPRAKWCDVCRVGDNSTLINGLEKKGSVGYPTVNEVSPSALPFVALDSAGKYHMRVDGVPTRTPLILADGEARTVCSIDVDGAQVGMVTVATEVGGEGCDAGVHCSVDGVFTFVGGKVLFGYVNGAASYYTNSTIRSATISVTQVTATYAAPYLQTTKDTSDLIVTQSFDFQTVTPPPKKIALVGATVSGNPSASGTFEVAQGIDLVIVEIFPQSGEADVDYILSGSTRNGTLLNFTNYTYTPHLSCAGDHEETYYAGTPFETLVKYDTSVESRVSQTNGNHHLGYPNNLASLLFFYGAMINYLDGSSVSSVQVSLARVPGLKMVEGTHTHTAVGGHFHYADQLVGTEVNFNYNPALERMGLTQALAREAKNGSFEEGTYKKYSGVYNHNASWSAQTFTESSTYTTRDFIFCDPDEEVFVYLEVVTHADRSYVGSSIPSAACHIGAQYVVYFRGVLTRIVATPDTALDVGGQYLHYVGVDGRRIEVEYPLGGHRFFSPLGAPADYQMPQTLPLSFAGCSVPLMCAPFTNQGNCPYIAFTTKAEEAAGAISQYYVDFSVKPVRPLQGLVQADAEKYKGVVSFVAVHFSQVALSKTPYDGSGWNDSSFPWNTVLNASNPFRIQVANGVAGPWQGALGGDFVNGTQLEISRI